LCCCCSRIKTKSRTTKTNTYQFKLTIATITSTFIKTNILTSQRNTVSHDIDSLSIPTHQDSVTSTFNLHLHCTFARLSDEYFEILSHCTAGRFPVNDCLHLTATVSQNAYQIVHFSVMGVTSNRQEEALFSVESKSVLHCWTTAPLENWRVEQSS